METTSSLIVIFTTSLIVALLMAFYTAISTLETAHVQWACANTQKIIQIGLINEGLLPSTIKFFDTGCNLTQIKPKTVNAPYSIRCISNESDSEFGGFGIVMDTSNKTHTKHHGSKLNPPLVLLSGEINEENLPLRNIIAPPEHNPSGTFFRYTTDGTTPTDESPVWENASFTENDLPPSILFRAFHADGIYSPSGVVEAKFSLPKPSISISREDGSSDLSISIHEIQSDTRRIVLLTSRNNRFYNIYYSVNGSTDFSAYISPFHIPAKLWSQRGTTITVKIAPKSAYFEDFWIESFSLAIRKVRLPNPIIKPDGSNELVAEKENIQVENPSLGGIIQANVNGKNLKTTDRFLEIPISFNP